jgi:hypothetical protein
MIDDAAGRTFGYLGLAHIDWVGGTFEADGVVRGLDGVPGGMTAALATVMEWAVGQLGLAQPLVRVRSDNPRAVGFYQALGFVRYAERGLRRVVHADMVRWVEDDEAPAGTPRLLYMSRPTGQT